MKDLESTALRGEGSRPWILDRGVVGQDQLKAKSFLVQSQPALRLRNQPQGPS